MDRNHGIFFAINVSGIDINLRSVKGSFTDILHIRNLQFVHNITHVLLGLLPNLWLTNIFFTIIRIPLGQMIGNILLNTQRLQTMLCQCQTILKFLHHLIRSYDQMSLGNGKLTDSGQSVHFTGILISE